MKVEVATPFRSVTPLLIKVSPPATNSKSTVWPFSFCVVTRWSVSVAVAVKIFSALTRTGAAVITGMRFLTSTGIKVFVDSYCASPP